jgi:two-component system vancomycin resistance associated response regulator VraR
MSYKVLLADDHHMARTALNAALAGADAFEVVASVPRASEAVEYVRKKPVDLVVLDVVMPGQMNGLAAAREIRSISPETKILIITSMPEVSYIRRAREIGVESFWYKEAEEQPLLAVMKRTMAGESVYPDDTPPVKLGNVMSSDFTERELEVLRGLVGGASNREIGDQLGIAENTVKMHVANMLQKTGFRSRLELAVRARADGLIIAD